MEDVLDVIARIRGISDFKKKNVEKVLGFELRFYKRWQVAVEYRATPEKGFFTEVVYDIRCLECKDPPPSVLLELKIRKEYRVSWKEVRLRYGRGKPGYDPPESERISVVYYEPNQYYSFCFNWYDPDTVEEFHLWRYRVEDPLGEPDKEDEKG